MLKYCGDKYQTMQDIVDNGKSGNSGNETFPSPAFLIDRDTALARLWIIDENLGRCEYFAASVYTCPNFKMCLNKL